MDGQTLILDDGTRVDDLEQLKSEQIECNLPILGSTGVEDLLHDNVSKCIQDFKTANMRVWMLTGDKGLTAKQIAIACGMIPKQAKPGQS